MFPFRSPFVLFVGKPRNQASVKLRGPALQRTPLLVPDMPAGVCLNNFILLFSLKDSFATKGTALNDQTWTKSLSTAKPQFLHL